VQPTADLAQIEYDRVIAAVFMPVTDGAFDPLRAVVADDKLIFLEGSKVA
jgi:hypothetical protein